MDIYASATNSRAKLSGFFCALVRRVDFSYTKAQVLFVLLVMGHYCSMREKS